MDVLIRFMQSGHSFLPFGSGSVESFQQGVNINATFVYNHVWSIRINSISVSRVCGTVDGGLKVDLLRPSTLLCSCDR